MWAERERKHEINKGRICKEPGCEFATRVKGYCVNCYRKVQNRMTYKKAGVDVEREEKAIEILIGFK